MVAFFRLLMVAALIGSVGGCGRRAPEAGRPETFIFARGSDAQKLDPADVDDGESVNVINQMMEGLVRFASGTLEIEPCLAESYETSADGLVYTFQIRPGVQFHDGTPLTAQAAAASFERQMDPAHPGHFEGAQFQYWNYLYQEITHVRAVGPMTLEIRLREPNASLLHSLAVFPAYLVSPQAILERGSEFQRRPVGTGPYQFVSWAPNQAIVLQRNPNYWDAERAPGFERLVFKVVPENTVRLLELKAGQIHGLDGIQPAELAGLAEDPRFRVYREPGMNVGYLAFQMENPRFAEAEVRRAVAMAIDRDTLVQVALEGMGRRADFPIPPGFVGYPTGAANPIPHDPERAREILARYGDRWAEPVRLHVMNAPRHYLPEPVQAASLIRSDLERVGLKVEIVTRDFKSHLDATRAGEFDLAILGWMGDNGDTDNFLSIFFGSWSAVKGAATNISFYRNPEMDRLLLAARRSTDPAERAKVYGRVLELWRRDLPLVPLVHGENAVVLRSEVTGFRIQRTEDLRLGGMGWEEEAAAAP